MPLLGLSSVTTKYATPAFSSTTASLTWIVGLASGAASLSMMVAKVKPLPTRAFALGLESTRLKLSMGSGRRSLTTTKGIVSSVMPGLKVSIPDWAMKSAPPVAVFETSDQLTVTIVALASLSNTVNAALVSDSPIAIFLARMTDVAMIELLKFLSE